MLRWNHLVEARVERYRELQREARSHPTPDNIISYFQALRRTKQAPDLSVMPKTERGLASFISDLWRSKELALVFNDNFDFGNPGTHDAAIGVDFLSNVLSLAHDKVIRGVKFTQFFRFVRNWLRKHGEDRRWGRSSANTPLEQWVASQDPEETFEYNVDGNICRHQGIPFPSSIGDHYGGAGAYGMHFGELVALGDNINGGAVYRLEGTGLIYNFAMYPNENSLLLAWEELVTDWVPDEDDDEDDDTYNDFMFPEDHPPDEMDNAWNHRDN